MALVVDVDFRKWDGHPHWRYTCTLLGRDDYGTWLGGLPGVSFTGPRGAGAWQHTFVQLIPQNKWWAAVFNATGEVELYIDVTTPARWTAADRVTMVDLDLDVYRRRAGAVILDDADEFEEHRVAYSYPDDVVANASATTDELMSAVAGRREPFGGACRRWFGALTG